MNNEEEQFGPIEANMVKLLFLTQTQYMANTTKQTRISVNIRIKNWFSPDMVLTYQIGSSENTTRTSIFQNPHKEHLS